MSQATFEPETQPEPAPPPQKSSRGCLYGCLFVVFSGIALLVCAGVGSYWWISNQVEKFTSATPAELPTVDYDPEELAELEKRVDTFTEAFDRGEIPPDDLVLTAEEINALIGKDEDMRGKVFVKIEDGQVSGDVSIPVPEVIPGGEGRYFNGSGSFEVSMNGGVLIVTMTDGEVNGERLPQEAIDALARENLAKGVYDNPDAAKTLRQFESVSIEDDKIILKVRREKETTDEAEADAGESTEETPAAEEASEAAPQASPDESPAAAPDDSPAAAPEESGSAPAETPTR